MAKWEDAYQPGEHTDGDSLRDPARDPSIEHEPHMRADEFMADPSEQLAGQELDPLGGRPSLEDQVDAAVWEEPALSHELAPEPAEDALTYRRWLEIGQSETTWRTSWSVCAAIACLSGPAAVIGTFLSQNAWGLPAIVTIGLVGPLAEEVMKVAAVLWTVEKRPYLFKSGTQILLCVLASGCIFAAIENVLYLTVYVPNPSAGLILWRWTVCVLLHTSCSFVAGLGLRRVWNHVMRERIRPRIALASNYLMAAVAIHATYNTAAIVLEGLATGF